MSKHCRPGLDDRCRDNNGEIRQKNGSTRIGTLRDTYGENFAEGMRSDMRLDTLLNRTGSKSLSQYFEEALSESLSPSKGHQPAMLRPCCMDSAARFWKH
jgi:hypothetical protein